MDVKIFKLFETVCEERNISIAARKLDMTQQGVSAALKRLDAEIGVPLVVADQTGTVPTRYGRLFLELSQACTSALDRFEGELAAMRAREGNQLRIACVEGYMDYVGRDAIAQISGCADILVDEFPSPKEVEHALRHLKYDLAVSLDVGGPGIVSRLLVDDPFYLWVGQDNVDLQVEEFHLADLDGQAVAFLDVCTALPRQFIEASAKYCPNISLVPAKDVMGIYEAVLSGVAFGLIGRNYVGTVGTKGVKAVPLVDHRLRYYLCHSFDTALSPEAEKFSEALIGRCLSS